MKVLFICRANIGRSQMAKALFDKISGEVSESAGARVSEERSRMRLGEISGAENVVKCMKEDGIDLSRSRIRQVTQEMVRNVDRVVVMTSKENLPRFVLESKKIEFWRVMDPKGTDLDHHRKTRDQIRDLIRNMLNNSCSD